VSVIAVLDRLRVAGARFLLSFLPESDINRIAITPPYGKRSFAALVPTMPMAMWSRPRSSRRRRKGGRVIASRKYGADRAGPARTVAQSLGSADALLIATMASRWWRRRTR